MPMKTFGLAGVSLFILGMAMPILLHIFRYLPLSHTQYKKSVVTGIVIYLTVAISDGAILHIPVMVFYWLLVSLLASNNQTPLKLQKKSSTIII